MSHGNPGLDFFLRPPRHLSCEALEQVWWSGGIILDPFMKKKAIFARMRIFKTCIIVLTCCLAGKNLTAQSEDAALPLSERQNITGNWAGARPYCCDHGVDFFAGYTAEVWGNTTGGIQTGAVYTGLMDFGAQIDLEKFAGWQGASMSTSWLWLSGRDASEDLVGNKLTVSNIAGFNTLRLLDLWFQQELLDKKISIRAGQLTADSDFIVSEYGALFINATFGWPSLVYMNIPNGGAGTPVGTLGSRLAFAPVDWFTFQSAIFQGNVFAQDVNRHGFRYRLDAQTGFTFMNEGQFSWGQSEDSQALPGMFKPGVWFQTGQNADALASKTSSGNAGFYAMIDQLLIAEPSELPPTSGKSKDGKSAPAPAKKSNQGLGFFGRVGFAPSDRNAVEFYFDSGLTYKGPIPSRDNDSLGIAFGMAQFSKGFQNQLVNDSVTPDGAEMVLETTYQVEITPFMLLQPDVQYIINPGANRNLDNAFVIGCRASFTF